MQDLKKTLGGSTRKGTRQPERTPQSRQKEWDGVKGLSKKGGEKTEKPRKGEGLRKNRVGGLAKKECLGRAGILKNAELSSQGEGKVCWTNIGGQETGKNLSTETNVRT